MFLQDIYSTELKHLIELFGERKVEESLLRLNIIFEKTEGLWNRQVGMIPNGRVRYLLIAEAPPWSENGDVVYVYNPTSEPRSLLPAICRALFGEHIYRTVGTSNALINLAKEGFLLIDSLPFAMDYSRKRSSMKYRKLVEACIESVLLKRINDSLISWDNSLKVAFSLKKNAQILIDYFSEGIPFPGIEDKIPVTSGNIAVNASHYPCFRKLREIYGLVGPGSDQGNILK